MFQVELVIGIFVGVILLIGSSLAQFAANLPVLHAGFEEQIATSERAGCTRYQRERRRRLVRSEWRPDVQILAAANTLRVPTQQQHRVAYVYD